MFETSAQADACLFSERRRQPLPETQHPVIASRHNFPAQGSSVASSTLYLLLEKKARLLY